MKQKKHFSLEAESPTLNWQFWLVGQILTEKGIFSQNKKSEHQHWILIIRFSLQTCHNILELYNILVQILFTISKKKLDIQYSKFGIRVASQVAQRLKT